MKKVKRLSQSWVIASVLAVVAKEKGSAVILSKIANALEPHVPYARVKRIVLEMTECGILREYVIREGIKPLKGYHMSADLIGTVLEGSKLA